MSQLSEIGTGIVLVGAVLGVLAQWVIRPLSRGFKATNAAVEFIRHELSENSGRSVRDMTVRNDARFAYLFDHLGIDMPPHLKSPESEGTPHAS
jgi:hypothetical protein